MSDDQHVRRANARGDAALLGAVDQVIDEDAKPPARRRAELGDYRRQVVDAAKELDHNSDAAQVVAPDLLDELGVMAALDIDPARPGDLSPADRGGNRS